MNRTPVLGKVPASQSASMSLFAGLIGPQALPSPEPMDAQNRLLFFPNSCSQSHSRRIVDLLDKNLARFVQRVERPIPANSISKMRKNYTEKLGKAIRNGSLILNSRRTLGFRAAESIGLVPFLQSSSLREWTENLTGMPLLPHPGMQALCYQNGDYVSPHNDHHPEETHLRRGYIDVHFMFSNPYVKSQLLVYEKNHHLNQCADISLPSSTAIYFLPFWHYTTPLQAVAGHEAEARRWLIMASYVIDAERLQK